MAKQSRIILYLTIVIATGAFISILGFLIDLGIISTDLTETPKQVPPIATIPFTDDEGTQQPEDELPAVTTEELIDQFLRNLGAIQVETFGIDANVRLVDSNLEEQIQSSFLKVQPLDPREVVVSPDEEIDPSRFFINTDFSSQLADNGRNFHQFSGWNVVNEPRRCTGDPPHNCPIPVTVTTVKKTSCRVDNTGVCVQVSGEKREDDDVGNASYIHGLQKDIDISDWTREGDLIVEFDFDCDRFTRSVIVIATIRGQFGETFTISCQQQQTFSREVSELAGNSNTLTVEFGTRVTSVDNFRMNTQFNNVKVIGNSVAKREAIELLESFSIVQNNEERRILDLGFIEVSLTGKTLEDNQRVSVNGVLETRIDGKTVSTHQVTGSGVTMMNEIPLRIDGENIFIFELSKQYFDPETFHILRIILNDFIVTVGEGDNIRTFEYHTPFVAYTLEFNVNPDEIIAFNTKDQAITVQKSETIFQTCGLSSGEDPVSEPEILPPEVSIIQNGFTIATTNPEAGRIQATDPFTENRIPNTQFCGTITNLPTNTVLTFKIGNEFHEVSIPNTQKTYFVNCNREGCTSNIGYSSG